MKDIKRYKVLVTGIVQGVGFRPFVYQLAKSNDLKGWVRNTSSCVEIDVEGSHDAFLSFINSIENNSPPASRIEKMEWRVESDMQGYEAFSIIPSQRHANEYQLVSPDMATCGDCIEDISNPHSRHYRYPFTNCTNCGPRFTIITNIPYDREETTMRSFKMCAECQREYDNPNNRRFHAQPNACPSCGPILELVKVDSTTVNCESPISETSMLLKKGEILAIKGLGGFLLSCDATNFDAVNRLRLRKKRPSKPFAVMFPDVISLKRYCLVSIEEEELLLSSESPIVLLLLRPDTDLANNVAPNYHWLGAMLPYTPLHHLLMNAVGAPLVMTSGNLSEEPIATDNKEAQKRLGKIADYFLWHNRDIHVRYDDSVAYVFDGGVNLIRRARGYAPSPVILPYLPKQQILACGAEMKSTFCLTRDKHAFLSQHIGDVENELTLRHYKKTISEYKKLFRISPTLIATDAHPDYLTTRYGQNLAAEGSGIDSIQVQHHHAHIASCMAENGLNEPVLGIAMDGTGYGADGTIWGGEILLADYAGFKRLGHLENMPLPGGDTATRFPLKIAASYLLSLFGADRLTDSHIAKYFSPVEIYFLKFQIENNFNAPLTSSCGRLFDAVSALLGICYKTDYEAQAAIALEMVAAGSNSYKYYHMDVSGQNGERVIRLGALIDAIMSDKQSGVSVYDIALSFHMSLAKTIAETCISLSRENGIRSVALSGGVFNNRLLTRHLSDTLERNNLKVYKQKLIPTNDGGIALGQAAIAAFKSV